MTSMQEKKPSTKAKTFNRYNGKQDHGDAHSRKGHDNIGYWERRWEDRGAASADRTALKEADREAITARDDIRDDTLMLDMAEEDKKMAETWAQVADEDDHYDEYDEMYYSSDDNIYAEDGPGHTDQLKYLSKRFEQLTSELRLIPRLDENDPDFKPTDQARLQIEAEMQEIKAEIDNLLGQPEGSQEAAVGRESASEIKKRLARAATLDDYSDDDFGDTEQESHMRIHRMR